MKLRHLAIGVLIGRARDERTPGRSRPRSRHHRRRRPPPTKSQPVVLKGRAPVSKDVLQVKLPRPAEADLANGLHVMVLEDRRLPQISFQILIPGAGGYFDPADSPGLAVGHGGDDARRHDVAHDAADCGVARDEWRRPSRSATGIASTSATVSGSSLTENFDDDLGAGRRHPAESVVPAGRARPLPDADPGGPRHSSERARGSSRPR